MMAPGRVALVLMLGHLQLQFVGSYPNSSVEDALGNPVSLSIADLHRVIDLTASVARTTTTFTIHNHGTADASSVLVAVETAHRVAYMSFETADGTALSWHHHIVMAGNASPPPGYELYAVQVALSAGGSLDMTSYLVCAGAMGARPAAISQGEPQYMSYVDQLYVPSPYAVSGAQVTTLVLPTAPRRYPVLETVELQGNILTYGPFRATGAWAVASEPANRGVSDDDSYSGAGELRINFEHSAAPFFTVGALTRTVELSHWGGQLTISDRYQDLKHSGAKLHEQQGWSRLDYEKATHALASLPARFSVDQLQGMSVSALHELATKHNVDGYVVDDAMEAERPKEALIEVLMRKVSTRPETPARATSAWRQSNDNQVPRVPHRDGTISSFTVRLPTHATAGSVFFRDELGNVSTSHIERDSLVLRPRFPLTGGWRTSFETGYSAQLSNYLHVIGSGDSSSSDRTHVLTLSPGVGVGVCPQMDGIVAEEFILKIVLPEGAKDVAVHAPPGYFGLDGAAVATELRATSAATAMLGKWWGILDTVGRPLVVLSHSLLVEEHCFDTPIPTGPNGTGQCKRKEMWEQQPQLQVSYRFDATHLWWEPLQLVGLWGLLFCLFITCNLAGRFDLGGFDEDLCSVAAGLQQR